MITKRKFVNEALLVTLGKALRELQTMQEDPFANEKELNRADLIPEFLRWCTERLINIDGVEIREIPGCGFGVVATQKLSLDQLSINVPFKAMLTSKDCMQEFRLIIPQSMDKNWHQVL